MADDRWIIVNGWDKFQHYTNRDPPWIKLYTNLNSEDEWGSLNVAERGVLATIWTEYARSKGVITVAKVVSLCARSARQKHFESLSDAGFITLSASKPLAQIRKEEEKKKKRTPPTQSAKVTADGVRPEKTPQNAGAYNPMDAADKPDPVNVDDTMLELAKGWLGYDNGNPHRGGNMSEPTVTVEITENTTLTEAPEPEPAPTEPAPDDTDTDDDDEA